MKHEHTLNRGSVPTSKSVEVLTKSENTPSMKFTREIHLVFRLLFEQEFTTKRQRELQKDQRKTRQRDRESDVCAGFHNKSEKLLRNQAGNAGKAKERDKEREMVEGLDREEERKKG